MAEDRTNAPSAEELKARMDKLGAQEASGAGDNEPDPATGEAPPDEIRAGDQKRVQT